MVFLEGKVIAQVIYAVACMGNIIVVDPNIASIPGRDKLIILCRSMQEKLLVSAYLLSAVESAKLVTDSVSRRTCPYLVGQIHHRIRISLYHTVSFYPYLSGS